ncbi:MAG: hypothetical protein R2912_11845 [Eubacteriales bacterium]
MSILLSAIVPHPPIILPPIGQGQEREIRATIAAYQEIARRVRQLSPDTIVVISSHATSYADYFHISPGSKARGDMKRFGAGQMQVNAVYDEEFVAALERNRKHAGVFAGTKGEREKSSRPWFDHTLVVPRGNGVDERSGAHRHLRAERSGALPPRKMHQKDC